MAGPVTTGAGGEAVTDEQPIVGIPDPVPAVLPTAVIPADGFHDTREVAAAQAGNLPTQDGYPLHPAAKEVLQGIRSAIDGMRSWTDWAEAQLNKAAAIGSGH